MESARILKAKIADATMTAGVLACQHAWPGLVETCMRAELDFLILDMEHGVFPETLAAELCAIGRRCDFAVLIRPLQNDFFTLGRAIDLGPCGLMCANVQDPATMDRIADAIRLPPRGRRSPGGPGNYWVSRLSLPNWQQEVEADFIVLPQIESALGVANTGAIAAHEITTAVTVGPFDLSADIGCCWNPAEPKLQDAMRAIRDAARDAGRKTMAMAGCGYDPVIEGYDFVCMGQVVGMLEQKFAADAAALKNARSASSAAGSSAG
jgi:2-dehydro-3-deoxyglucarate aldolase/4-hydroxy-2-oxoheptanedioate aldolase